MSRQAGKTTHSAGQMPDLNEFQVDPALQQSSHPSDAGLDDDYDDDDDLEQSLIEQLSSAIREHQPGPSSAGHHAQPAAQQHTSSLGLGVDDQLLIDSLKSIINGGGDGGSELGSGSGYNNIDPSMRPHHHGPGHGDEATMQDALVLAKQMINVSQSNAIDPSLGPMPLNLPASLNGPTDAATLQAVQSVLQELGSSWGEEFGHGRRTTRTRRRQDALTSEDRERIREDNRNRKRKWRDTNSTRNKDNDLRARIIRRATLIYGVPDTTEKAQWVEEEFQKRRERRILRESEHGGDQRTPGSKRTHTHYLSAGESLMQLFQRSNMILQGSAQKITAGLIPEHLVRTLMVPSPSRPALFAEYKPPTPDNSNYANSARSVSLGFPPNLLKLATSNDATEVKIEQ